MIKTKQIREKTQILDELIKVYKEENKAQKRDWKTYESNICNRLKTAMSFFDDYIKEAISIIKFLLKISKDILKNTIKEINLKVDLVKIKKDLGRKLCKKYHIELIWLHFRYLHGIIYCGKVHNFVTQPSFRVFLFLYANHLCSYLTLCFFTYLCVSYSFLKSF